VGITTSHSSTLAYRFNKGQLYYGNILLDWYFYDPEQRTTAISFRWPTSLACAYNSDSSGFSDPSQPPPEFVHRRLAQS